MKDEQIEALQKEIHDVTIELQHSADIISSFKPNNNPKEDHNQWKSAFQHLQMLLKHSEEKNTILSKQLEEAEIHALRKDKEFTSVYARLKEYEQGEYGLSEAVAEIKDVRSQLKIRDRQIEDLTHRLNKYELLISDSSFVKEETPSPLNSKANKLAKLKTEKDEMIKKLEKTRTVLMQDIANLDSQRNQLKDEIQQYLQKIKECCNQFQISPSELKLMLDHIKKPSKEPSNVSSANNNNIKKMSEKEIQTDFDSKDKLPTNEAVESNISEKGLSPSQGRLMRRYKKLLSFTKDSENNNLKIMQLNTHLLHVLKELKSKTEQIEKLDEKLNEYKNKFPVAIHQIGLLYSDYLKEKDQWLKDKKKLETDFFNMKVNAEVSSLKLKDYESLSENLKNDDNYLKQRIGEMCRENISLKSDNVVISQKYHQCKENELKLEKENSKLQTQLLEFETAVIEKLSSLKQQKELNEYKIAALQGALDKSLPKKEFDETNKQLFDVTSKYHQLIQKQIWLCGENNNLSNNENSKYSQINTVSLMEELKTEKEKNKSLENLLKELSDKGFRDDEKAENNVHVRCFKEKLLLKIKAINEEQRSTTANQIYQCENEIVKHLNKRILDLEAKVEELIKINLEQQKQDFDLQEFIKDSISPSVHKALLEKVDKFQNLEAELRRELHKEKTAAEISFHQVHALERINETLKKEIEIMKSEKVPEEFINSRDTEIEDLRKQLLESQKSNSVMLFQLEKLQYQIPQLEKLCLTLENKCNSKDEENFTLQSQYRDKIHRLLKIIHHLQKQLIGMIPLDKEERLVNRILNLQEEKKKLLEDIQNAENRVSNAEIKLKEAKLKNQNLDECKEAMKIGNHLEKLTELHQRITELKLSEVKQNRKNELLQLEISHQTMLLKHQEGIILQLEDQIGQMHQNIYVNEITTAVQ